MYLLFRLLQGFYQGDTSLPIVYQIISLYFHFIIKGFAPVFYKPNEVSTRD